MLTTFTIFVGFVVTLAIRISAWVQKNSSRVTGKCLPGPLNLPFFGCSLQVGYLSQKYKSFQVFEHFCKQYGPVMGLQIGWQYTVVVEDFEMAKHILNSEDWQGRNPDYSPFRKLTFDKQVGVMFAYGDGWRENRRFVLKTLKEMGFGLKNKLEMDLIEEFQYFVKHFDHKRLLANDQVRMHRVFKLASLNSLWRILCGTRCSEEDEHIKLLIGRVEDTAKGMGVGCQLQYAFPFLSYVPGLTDQQFQVDGMNLLHNYFKEILVNRRESDDQTSNPTDFIGMYLQKIESLTTDEGNQDPIFNDEQLIQNCSDMFLAGADTTGNLLEFAILYMTRYPDVQEKVQAEIDRVIGPDQVVTYSEADRLPYTQAVLLESMRHSTITPIIPRTSITSTLIKNCNVPKNAVALINFYKINHDPQVFGDPEVFRPERFLQNGYVRRDASTEFLQFGLGRRICVGIPLARATFFTCFTNFIKRYTVEPSPDHDTLSNDKVVTGVNNQPAPYWCLVKLR